MTRFLAAANPETAVAAPVAILAADALNVSVAFGVVEFANALGIYFFPFVGLSVLFGIFGNSP